MITRKNCDQVMDNFPMNAHLYGFMLFARSNQDLAAHGLPFMLSSL
ncbi:hypothetical protein SynROS8604_01947 [Synechococcus sp. ROS8604]|nr:hypothetical protein SynROS8604_01947 [Synechococcus sp. ROS8604]